MSIESKYVALGIFDLRIGDSDWGIVTIICDESDLTKEQVINQALQIGLGMMYKQERKIPT